MRVPGFWYTVPKYNRKGLILRYNHNMRNISLKDLRQLLNERPDTWFFIFATFTFIVMYIWSLFITPQLLEPIWLVIFTFLTLVHISIHWTIRILEKHPEYQWLYVIGQGLLAFVITYLSQNIGMIFCLYFALIGEVVGIFRRRIWLVFSLIYFLTLFMINFTLLVGLDQMLWWGIGTLPIVIFVMLYVSLYNKESKARAKAQKLLADLEVANKQMSEYAGKVEDLTLATERQRMARELHDTLAQGLAGLILQLEAADSYIANRNTEKTQTIIQQAMNRARSTLAEARDAIGDLRDTPTSPVDFLERIHSETEKFSRITGINCGISGVTPEVLPPEVAENVLRAVSEGLINVAKHAQATETNVKIECKADSLWVEIWDNGVGFSPEDVVGRSGHYGLLGIRERARILGGSMTIESVPDQATTLRIELPLVNERTKRATIDE
jgi:NarL family two-component system sensor histidine kinase YdfH